jgi:hypothetical protein
MVVRTLSFAAADLDVHARVAAAIESTPCDAVVQLRIDGRVPATLTAKALRAMAGARNVTIAAMRRRQVRLSSSWPVVSKLW